MNYYFITGSSKGLGKSLVKLLLKDKNNIIYGFARSASITHERYHHLIINLSDLDAVKTYEFPILKDASKIVLINNAGIIGDVNHVGKLDNQQIIDCYHLNLIAPAILMNNFIAKYRALKCKKLVVNISSGAGRTPIDGWSVYCSTKAGLDMFSQVLNEETIIDQSNVKVVSLAPGIIDTEMQVQIREANQKSFSAIEKFIEYKNNGDLSTPEDTAKKVLRFVNEEELLANVICSVRDLTE